MPISLGGEMADATVLEAVGSNPMEVQVLSQAQIGHKNTKTIDKIVFLLYTNSKNNRRQRQGKTLGMDTYLVAKLAEFLDQVDRLLDHELFGVLSPADRHHILARAKEYANDGKFEAMLLFDIISGGAPWLGHDMHVELCYKFLGFV